MADRELHIRINKHTFERVLFFIVILVLVILLVWKWNGASPILADVNVDELTAENTVLQAQITTLEAQVADLEEDLLLYEEAEQERSEAIQGATDPETTTPTETTPTVEEGLSGYVEVDWDITMDGSELDSVEIFITNGEENTQEVTYKLYWEQFFENTVYVQDTEVLRSGEEFSDFLVEGGQGIASNPPDEVDTLIIELRDGSGDLIDLLEEVVR